MSNKLSVLVLSSWYPTRINPTLGNFNEKFAEAIALYNDVTAIHVIADINCAAQTEYDRKMQNGVDKQLVYFKKKKKEFFTDKISKNYRYFILYINAYKQFVKEKGRPDIVHLNILYPAGIIALYLKKRYKISYVISENWTGYLSSNYVKQNFMVRWLRREIAKNASALLPVSLDLKKAMSNHRFGNSYYIVPNVTDTTFFKLPDKPIEREKKIILHVSSLLDTHKNITGLLNVMYKLYQTRQDFELHIIGDGDATPFKRYAEKLSILKHVVLFFDAMTPQQIAEKMKQSDFFVMFSNYENLPCVIVEALAAGLPVVSSTAGGIPEHITDDKGVLVEPKDENALLIACNYMLSNLHKYDKQKLYQYANDKFSYKSVGKRLTEIYNLCINNS